MKGSPWRFQKSAERSFHSRTIDLKIQNWVWRGEAEAAHAGVVQGGPWKYLARVYRLRGAYRGGAYTAGLLYSDMYAGTACSCF